MKDFLSFANKRTYEDFKRQIPSETFPLFDSMRTFCLSLGENVVEDVRMHRIVFGKSMTFRWFADLEPQEEGVVMKIQKDRKQSPEIILIKNNQDGSKFNEIIKNAFDKIR